MLAEQTISKAELEASANERAEKEHTRKLELHAVGMQNTTSKSSGETCAPKGPKLQTFNEGKDHIDSYIQQFELYATWQKWKKEQWGAILSALLKGKS